MSVGAVRPDAIPAPDRFPLSVFQRGMWFLEQLHPHNPAYLVPSAARVHGNLDMERLRRAVAAMAGRHESLRTTFAVYAGEPVQLVHPEGVVPVEVLDLSGADAGSVTAALRAAVTDPLDIQTGPLARVVVLRCAPEEHILVLALHHMICDRWSISVLLGEISAHYEADNGARSGPSAGGAPELQWPPLPIHYADFSVWQQEQLQAGRWDADLDYWAERLAGIAASLELPADHPRKPVQEFAGRQLPVHFPGELTGPVARLARGRGATAYMGLLAVFAVLLHRMARQDDIVVAVPATVRNRPELEGIVGYFVNTLPVRIRLEGNPPFVDVLDQVRDAVLGAFDHAEVPFDTVVARLNVPRDLSRSPVAQVSFSYGRDPAPTFRLGQLQVTPIPVDSSGARFDLELQGFEDGDGGLRGWFEYDSQLFDEPTVERLSRCLHTLLDQVGRAPETPVDELPVLLPEQQRVLVETFNATETAWPAGPATLHGRIEAQVRATPDAPAVRMGQIVLSYAELDRRANRLAHRLIALGVVRDTPVAVAMERSVELVIALLAVLKAGGAYLPLDPEYPSARLGAVLDSATPPVVLTHRQVADRVPATSVPLLLVDELGLESRGPDEDSPAVAVDGCDLAYVIYTSGSTGTPKGVMNIHSAIVNRLLWMQSAFPLDATDRVLQKTPYSFDVSVWEFFWPLMVGAQLVVARPGGHRDAAYLVKTIRAAGITTLHFVPSMLQIFLLERLDGLGSLRRVFASGEALPRELADRFHTRLACELHNLYGPTEAAVDVSHWPCRPDDPPGPVPIGRPIANTQLYVLDGRDALCPIGVAGELHIGGANLARGYLGRPDLTAERFIPNPIDPQRSPRLYRTGDLARIRPDGAIDYLGRLDHQVKLRGFRIELGEIETVLLSVPGIREAVVVAHEARPGDLRLVAYAVAHDPAPEPAVVLAAVRERLPDYMVPACIEMLPAMPLNSSGKVDRQRLPAPRRLAVERTAAFVGARDELEGRLVRIWQEVLGIERVGIHDSFFDLGGHSILLAQARHRLDEEGLTVSMVDLFHHPTIADLAAHLRDPDSGGARLVEAQERAAGRREAMQRRQAAAGRRG